MASTLDYSRESKELKDLLASGIFDRSPMLAQLLMYVCSKYFEGGADSIKEYSIAVDVLGRSSDFDPKKDSVIRVQFHRLREKLNEYYAHQGADHSVRIAIPHGHYAPQFLWRDDPASDEPEPEPEVIPVEEPRAIIPSSAPARMVSVRRLALAAVVLAALGTMAFSLSLGNGTHKSQAGPIAAAPVGDSIRILSGLSDGNYTDGYGHVWGSDRFFRGGTVATSGNHPVWGTRDPRLYQSWRQGAFSYDIPAKPGTYELRLYFAETHFGEGNAAGYGGENTRFFDISVNGVQVKRHFSVAGDAGVNVAVVKVFKDVTPASDGFVHIAFEKVTNEPFVNAIELTPGMPGQMNPIRLVAQAPGYTDSKGQVWISDRLAFGGQVVARTADVTGATDPQLYAGERFGNFSYTIPVTPGKYTVTFYMSERWLGPGLPGGQAGKGSRVFDILCNGVFLERDFDVFARAGGPNKALVRTYRAVEPNHQGNIVLSFVPIKNFPLVSALEIVLE